MTGKRFVAANGDDFNDQRPTVTLHLIQDGDDVNILATNSARLDPDDRILIAWFDSDTGSFHLNPDGLRFVEIPVVKPDGLALSDVLP